MVTRLFVTGLAAALYLLVVAGLIWSLSAFSGRSPLDHLGSLWIAVLVFFGVTVVQIWRTTGNPSRSRDTSVKNRT